MSAARPIYPRWGLTVAGPILLVALTQAASPMFWRVSTQAEFLKGEVENLSIDSTGQLLLGPVSEAVFETTSPFLWATAEAGGVLWIGSGNDGRVFRIEDDSEGQTIFDADQLNVHAIAAIDRDTAYVGTSPDGAVFRVSTSGEPQTVFDPDEQYIWAVTHGIDGDLFVATGNPGRIYRVTPDGAATLFYETKSTHVLSLAVDPDGNVLAGTGSPGRVFRITPTGNGFVVLDSSFNEIRSLRFASDDVLYAVAVSQSPGQAVPASSGVPTAGGATVTVSTSVSETVTVTTNGATSTGSVSSSSAASGASSTASGAVYRIMPDGVWDTVWESAVDAPYDVAFTSPVRTEGDPEPTGRTLLIATGGNGKIFRVSETPKRVVLLARAPAQQVTQFVAGSDGGHYFATANPGKIYRLAADQAATGTYISPVKDAETVATWGTVRWRATTPERTSVELFTRTGNTEEPNDTWSAWSGAYSDPTGSQVTSPKARYIQWKAQLHGGDASPVLFSVTTAYLPRNLAPEITDVTVLDPGVVFQQSFSSTDPPIAGLSDEAEARAPNRNSENLQNTRGRRVFRKGLQTFVWTTRDGNEDDLTYDAFYRTDVEAEWSPLAEGLRESIFTWDTSSVPDGTYVFRVVATDALSNPPGLALRGTLESTAFDIDNSPPQIMIEAVREQPDGVVIGFVVNDSHSAVARVEFSLDTERWQLVYPLDGIPDSQAERFEVALDATEIDRLIIRASDAMGNTVTMLGQSDGRR